MTYFRLCVGSSMFDFVSDLRHTFLWCFPMQCEFTKKKKKKKKNALGEFDLSDNETQCFVLSSCLVYKWRLFVGFTEVSIHSVGFFLKRLLTVAVYL